MHADLIHTKLRNNKAHTNKAGRVGGSTLSFSLIQAISSAPPLSSSSISPQNYFSTIERTADLRIEREREGERVRGSDSEARGD